MIPARLLDIHTLYRAVDNSTMHTPLKLEMDGGGEGPSPRAFFMDSARSRRTTPPRPVSTSAAPSSWDDSSDSEPELVGTINTGQEPWFNIMDHRVLRESELDEAIEKFEEELDDKLPLKFRKCMPFMTESLKRLREDLADRMGFESLLTAIPGSAEHPELDTYADVTFPVKRPADR